jgi:hypothetical protein
MRRGQPVRAGSLCPGALQGTLHRSFARLEHLRDLRRSETEYAAQHEHGPVSRRQLLEAATNPS